MIGNMNQASKGNNQAGINAQRIWRKLAGTADPAFINKRGMSAKQIKAGMGGFTK